MNSPRTTTHTRPQQATDTKRSTQRTTRNTQRLPTRPRLTTTNLRPSIRRESSRQPKQPRTQKYNPQARKAQPTTHNINQRKIARPRMPPITKLQARPTTKQTNPSRHTTTTQPANAQKTRSPRKTTTPIRQPQPNQTNTTPSNHTTKTINT